MAFDGNEINGWCGCFSVFDAVISFGLLKWFIFVQWFQWVYEVGADFFKTIKMEWPGRLFMERLKLLSVLKVIDMENHLGVINGMV